MSGNTVSSIYSREASKGDYTASYKAYYLKDWQGYDMPPHSHDRMEIMYVIGGVCSVKTLGETFCLKKGQLILLDSGVPHGLKVAGDAPCRIMNIEFTFRAGRAALSLREAASHYPPLRKFISSPRPALVFTDTEDIDGVLRRILTCLDTQGEGRLFELELLTAELFMALSRLGGEESAARRTAQAHARHAMQFMNQNYFHEISVKDVSRSAGVVEGYLSRVFKQSFGQTMMEYLTALRVGKAKMLLERTELPVADISGYIGISSRIYFSQMFKKHTGMTPGEYRKACSTKTTGVSDQCR